MKQSESENKRNEIQSLFIKGIESALPKNLFEKYLLLQNNLLTVNSINQSSKTYNLEQFENIYITGAGKAVSSMAKALENILEEKIHSGIVVTKYGFLEKLNKIKLLEAAHPVPDENSVNAANEILQFINNAGKNDLVINLISGGASALLTLPVDEISLDDKINTTKLLLRNEASIHEINTLRKCLSKVKGGGLVKDAEATVISLIISDVIGDDIEFIASGPTVVSNLNYAGALNIIEKFNLQNVIPVNVLNYLDKKRNDTGINNDIKSSPAENYLIGNNDVTIDKIIELAKAGGYKTYKINKKISGEVRTAAKEYFDLISGFKKNEKPLCIVSGGETTVNIKGNGLGGRNQEFCLSLIEYIKGENNLVILSGGTDGNDGPTDAAGAVIDNEIINEAEAKDINYKIYLDNNDSYNFFDELNSLVKTGPTLTNVMDIQITLLY